MLFIFKSLTSKTPSTLPYLPTSLLSKVNSPYFSKSINLSLEAKPLAFSSRSLVLDSGESIPANLIRLCTLISNPKSI